MIYDEALGKEIKGRQICVTLYLEQWFTEQYKLGVTGH
jgi:hypothetical protein